MWLTAERTFVPHVCLRNPYPPFLLAACSIQSLPEAWGSWERKYVPPPPRYGCIMPIPSLQLQKKTCLTQRSRGFCRGVVVSKICYNTLIVLSVVLCDCCKPWTTVEIEFLATVGWKWGGQPFSCRCTQNVTYCRKEICSTCLFKESIPTIPFGSLQHPVPTRSCFLGAAARSTSSALWLHHVHPFVAAAGKTCCMQRSRGFGNRVVVSKKCYSIYTDCAPMWLLQTKLLASAVWKRSCQPFSWPHLQNVTHCRKEICWTCLFKESIPAIPFGNSRQPLHTRSLRFLWATGHFISSALWLHHAHPFVAAVGKRPVACREAEGFVAELWSPRFVTTQWSCSQLCYVTAANQWTIVEIEFFFNSGLEMGLPAFQLQMYTKCDVLPKRDLLDMFV